MIAHCSITLIRNIFHYLMTERLANRLALLPLTCRCCSSSGASAGSKWMFYGEQRNSATWMLKYCASHAPYLQLFPSEHQSHILPFDRVRSRRNHAICKFDFEYKQWVKLKHSRCMLQSNSCWIKANVHRDGFTCFTPSFSSWLGSWSFQLIYWSCERRQPSFFIYKFPRCKSKRALLNLNTGFQHLLRFFSFSSSSISFCLHRNCPPSILVTSFWQKICSLCSTRTNERTKKSKQQSQEDLTNS